MNRQEARTDGRWAKLGNRGNSGARLKCRLFLLSLSQLLLVLLIGCVETPLVIPEDEPKNDKLPEVKTIGDLTSFANAESITVSGVGLVVGLEGTGGDPAPDGYRGMLEEELKRQKVDNPKKLLASKDTSVVLVTAQIPAGARKGDRIDVEITLPPNSRTTSLRGGYLRECQLADYESARDIAPLTAKGDGAVKGHVLAVAQGPLLVGFADGDDSVKLKQGKIWGGATSKIERQFYLLLNENQQYAHTAQALADRINETFHGKFRGSLTSVAEAKTKSYVLLSVPHQYRLNLPRYLRVVRLIPLRDGENRKEYLAKLQEHLLDPAHTVQAALRLEALGPDAAPTLKKGLPSTNVLVRFSAAEALAYLGNSASGEVLARLVEDQYLLRSFSLTALASLDEAICHVQLRELLNSKKPETRYGAFRALRALDENDEAVRGEQLNESFWLHRTAIASPPLVHLATSKRAEIVVFGEHVELLPPFSFLAGEFTIAAGKDDDRCTVSRISIARGPQRLQCKLQLEEIIRTLAELGGLYPDAFELVRQADKCQCLSAPLAIDALPQKVTVQQLALAGAEDPEFQKNDADVLKARDEFGATPTLFAKSDERRLSRKPKEKDDSEESEEKVEEPRRTGRFQRRPTWGR